MVGFVCDFTNRDSFWKEEVFSLTKKLLLKNLIPERAFIFPFKSNPNEIRIKSYHLKLKERIWKKIFSI